MKKIAIPVMAILLMASMVSSKALAAENVAKPAASEWVPPGFESLNEPQVTEIDLYYGDEFLTAVFARFTQTELSFINTDAITHLLRNISDPESVNLILQKPFNTNAGAICHSEFQTDCGKLNPETIDIIFDRASLRADLFINPELLLAGEPLQNRFLPESSADFSLFTDNAFLFSGVDEEQTTYNFVNTTRIALAESRLVMRSNVTDTQGLSVDTLAWQKEFEGKDYQFGLFRSDSNNFRFMGSEQFIGASMASSVLTRIDLDQSLGTEIELFFGSRSRIEILRDGRLLASGYYDVGNQIIDTSMLPPGSYEIEINITDSTGALSTERRFFSKTSKLPPEDQAIYFLQAGTLTNQGIDGGIPQQGTSVVRGGYSKRLSPTLGADVGFSATQDSTVYAAGLYKMGSSYDLKAEVAIEDNGAMGADVNLRWDMDFIRMNLSSRKVWEGESSLQLGDSYSQHNISLDLPTRWGSFGLFARTNDRDLGLEGRNYGLRWQANGFSIGEGNLNAGFELSKNDDDVLALLSFSYRFSNQRSQHSFTPGLSYARFAADQTRQSRFLGSHLSTWSSGEADQRRLTVRADRDEQTSFEARFEDQYRVGDSDFRARYNAGSGQLEYSGQLSSSYAYTPAGSGFGGRARGESAFIVRVDGAPAESEFEVMINGSTRGRTFAGKRLLIPVAPYETYKVELNPLGDTIIDLDDKTYQKTVYPGNVVALKWSASIIKIIIGRIVDETGAAIEGALIRNVKGFGVTGDRGFFQAEVEQNSKSLIIQKGINVCEAKFELEDQDQKVFSLGTLTCNQIDDPIVQFLSAPASPDLVVTHETIDASDAEPVTITPVAKLSGLVPDSPVPVAATLTAPALQQAALASVAATQPVVNTQELASIALLESLSLSSASLVDEYTLPMVIREMQIDVQLVFDPEPIASTAPKLAIRLSQETPMVAVRAPQNLSIADVWPQAGEELGFCLPGPFNVVALISASFVRHGTDSVPATPAEIISPARARGGGSAGQPDRTARWQYWKMHPPA